MWLTKNLEFRYNDGSAVCLGDRVQIDRFAARRLCGGIRLGRVTSLGQYVTIEVAGGAQVDLTMQNIQKIN